MIHIKDYDEAERILATNKDWPDRIWTLVPKTAVNVYYDYQTSKEQRLDRLNIRHLENIPATVQELRRLGISEFTTTDAFSNLPERLFELQRHSVRVVSLKKVITNPIDENRKPEALPGILLEVL